MGRSVNLAFGPMEGKPLDTRVSPAVSVADREAEWLGLVGRAAGKAGLSHKALAADLGGLDSAQLSRQLSGAPNHHLSFRRMVGLPPEFWVYLCELIAEFHGFALGGTQRDVEDAAIGRLVREAVTRCR